MVSSKIPPNAARNSLHPNVLHVLAAWEDLPLVEGFPEWSHAHIRLVAKLVLQGKLRECQAQGLEVGPEELRQARRWLYKVADRSIVSYKPLSQPWSHKELDWDLAAGGLKTIIPRRVPSDEDRPDNYQGPEGVGITRRTFKTLIQNCHQPLGQQIGQGPRGFNSGISARQDGRPERPNNDDELIDVSEDEGDTEDAVAWANIPQYLGEGTREEPFDVDRVRDPPADQHQPALVNQEPSADTEENAGASNDHGATRQDGIAQDSTDDAPSHGDQREPSAAISEATTAMAEGRVQGEADESDKENAARSYTYRGNTPTARQNIASANVISPIRAAREDDEMVHGHTSPDAMDIRRGLEDLGVANRSLLRVRKREPTPIDTTGSGEYDDMMDDGADRPEIGADEGMVLGGRVPWAIRRAVRANAEGYQLNIPGGNKRRRI
ncbi:MAG: hypothetical protein LQ350_003276 [Teloschistes chrysophthalmus]|nr:MAG: hypothetical protein LQ350_003276 [Niorma chrysophthalma]